MLSHSHSGTGLSPERSRWTLVALFVTLSVHGIGISALGHLWSEPVMLPPSRPLEVDLVAPPPKSVPVAQALPRVKPAVIRPPVRPMSPTPAEQPPPTVEESITQPEKPPLPVTESVAQPLRPVPPVPVNPPSFDAAYLNNPKPEYPRAAKKLGLQGTVLLRVQVSAEGQVEKINILTSSGVASLDEVAINTVQRWTFVPARQGDRTIPGTVNVPIRFTLN